MIPAELNYYQKDQKCTLQIYGPRIILKQSVKVKDLDGREYVDMSTMSVGACILGYADDDVDYEVQEAIKKGINSSLNCPGKLNLQI